MKLDELEAFLSERLRGPLPGAGAQRRFAPRPAHKGWSPELIPDTARRAGALILLYPGAAGPALPLTVRRHDLAQHAGQISLPGGALGPDETAEAAALREAHEEIGVDPDAVRIIGALSSFYVIVSNYVVFPYVGIARSRPDFRPEAREVAEIVEAPVSDFFDPSRRGWEQRPRGPITVDLPYVRTCGHMVWGATAMILGEFCALFDEGYGPPDPP
jgi:8-oxo-dGTP pyrophosphatase MutT (NUDIX family)